MMAGRPCQFGHRDTLARIRSRERQRVDRLGMQSCFADDYSRPAAAASEPVFWTEPTHPDDQRHPSYQQPQTFRL